MRTGTKGVSTTEYGRKLMHDMMMVYNGDQERYARLSGHGFRILAEAMEADLPYKLNCPSLLICGEKDHAGSCIRYNKAWHKRTGIPIRWIKGAGHNSNTDAPETVNRLVKRLIAMSTKKTENSNLKGDDMKKALLVIDMQNDYLWKKRKHIFSYPTDMLVNNVNKLIVSYKEKGYSVIYIKQVFPNLITNRLFIGFSIKGTSGADLYDGLKIVSDVCFEKHFSDAYSSRIFCEYMKKEGYTELALCGLDECGCVGATAKGAVKTGVNVIIVENCVGRRFSESKIRRMRNKLISMGIRYITEEL